MTVSVLSVQEKGKVVSYFDAIIQIDSFVEKAKIKKEQAPGFMLVGPRIYDELFHYLFALKDKPFQWSFMELIDNDPEDSMSLFYFNYLGNEIGRLKIKSKKSK
ncbi:MAG: hypothetical protein R2828_29455 [Saprospiraceae bacterium]